MRAIMPRYSLPLSHAVAFPPQNIERSPHFKLWQHIFAVYNFNFCIEFFQSIDWPIIRRLPSNQGGARSSPARTCGWRLVAFLRPGMNDCREHAK
jgi:hypothetical protein